MLIFTIIGNDVLDSGTALSKNRQTLKPISLIGYKIE